MKIFLALLLFVGSVAIANAQSTQVPSFDVASIKAAPPEPPGQMYRSTGAGMVTQDPGMISIKSVSLASLLARAYGLKPRQINGPDWITTQFYDLNAKLPAGATPDQIPAMLQQLITERFQATLRWDTKQETGYALVVDKGGPKLTLSAQQSLPDDKPDMPRTNSLSDKLRLTGAPISALVNSLSFGIGSPVVDSTGLKGRYDITLDVSFKDMTARLSGPSTSSDDSSSSGAIFDAVHELGLRLQPQKVETKYLVVVKADRIPTEN